MNREIKAKWVAALRSGEYKQGTNALRDSADRFCCLGVLCNLHAQAHPEIASKQADRTAYMGSIFMPDTSVFDWAGIDSYAKVNIRHQERYLANHNDDGRTFAEIADAIEEQL